MPFDVGCPEDEYLAGIMTDQKPVCRALSISRNASQYEAPPNFAIGDFWTLNLSLIAVKEDMLRQSLLIASVLFSTIASICLAAPPFKLLTVEPAAVPDKEWTLGLMETGYTGNNFFLNTNTLMDLGLTGNIGVKYVVPLNDTWSLTAGGRYLDFFGQSTAESFAKKQNSNIDSFKFNYSGYNLFLGSTFSAEPYAIHLNAQYADVSGSKIFNLISAASWQVSPFWHLVLEAGYDFENKQPRGSLGFLRQKENFGLRFGVTYVEIDDPALRTNVLPVIDLFWTFGGPS